MVSLDSHRVFATLVQQGIAWETIKTTEQAGVDLLIWLRRIDP